MSKIVAAALVFVCSAAVLMLEILAGRLLAPYVGISLETYTSIIGTVLAGIALGAWGGGKLADRVDPRRLLGPTVALGGLLALFTVPVVRSFGDQSSRGRPRRHALPRLRRLLPPRRRAQRGHADGREAAAPRPPAHRRRRRPAERHLDLRRPRRHVRHRLPARGDDAHPHRHLRHRRHPDGDRHRARALARPARRARSSSPSRCWAGRRRRWRRASSSPCQVESAYYCIKVEHDIQKPSGRILWLDDLMHSYVDLDDPTYLEFDYIKSFSDTVAVAWPRGPGVGRAAHRRRRLHVAAVSRRRVSRHPEHGVGDRPHRAEDRSRASRAPHVEGSARAHRRRRASASAAARTTRPTSSSVTRSAASPCPGTSAPGSSSRTSIACSGPTGCTSRT